MNNELLLEEGENIHVITRRGFDGDTRRHFAGVVRKVGQAAVRAEGYVFVLDTGTGKFSRRLDIRIRIVSLTDANVIINIIPAGVEIFNLKYKLSSDRRLMVTDDADFTMDIDEFNLR